MFQIAKKTQGPGGSFVKLVQLDSDDFAVIVRYPRDIKLAHRYVGPDFYKAEEVFDQETRLIHSRINESKPQAQLQPGKV